MHRGYVKNWRKIEDWEWFQDSKTFHMFQYLVMKANHCEGRYRGMVIPRGSLITGTISLSEKLGMSRQSVRTCLKHLTKSKDILVKSTNKNTVITICNYDIYQGENNQTNHQLTINQPSTNHQLTINQPSTNHKQELKELKEVKNEKKNKKETIKEKPMRFPKKSLKFNLAFEGYLDMRKKKRATATDKAIVLIFKKLHKLGSTEEEQIEILEESVLNNWTGVFALKPETQSNNNNYKRKSSNNQIAKIEFDENGRMI